MFSRVLDAARSSTLNDSTRKFAHFRVPNLWSGSQSAVAALLTLPDKVPLNRACFDWIKKSSAAGE